MIKIYPCMPEGKLFLKKDEIGLYTTVALMNALGGKIEILPEEDFLLGNAEKRFSGALSKAGLKKENNYRYNQTAHSFELDLRGYGSVCCELAVLFSVLKGNGKLYNVKALKKDDKEALLLLTGNLKSMRAQITVDDNCIMFKGVQALSGATVYAYRNMRILKSLLAASARCEGKVNIKGYDTEDEEFGGIIKLLDNTNINAEITELSDRKNIVLTGMSGCGKTTVGKMVAEILKMRFTDTDEVFVSEEKRSISDVFETDGEAYFRKKEKEIIERVSKRGGTVISTGGGVICDSENVSFLKSSGIIFYIKRDIEKIANQVKPDGRPLFKAGKKAVKKLFKERRKPYEAAADYEIENNSLPKEAAEKICDIYRGVEK